MDFKNQYIQKWNITFYERGSILRTKRHRETSSPKLSEKITLEKTNKVQFQLLAFLKRQNHGDSKKCLLLIWEERISK